MIHAPYLPCSCCLWPAHKYTMPEEGAMVAYFSCYSVLLQTWHLLLMLLLDREGEQVVVCWIFKMARCIGDGIGPLACLSQSWYVWSKRDGLCTWDWVERKRKMMQPLQEIHSDFILTHTHCYFIDYFNVSMMHPSLILCCSLDTHHHLDSFQTTTCIKLSLSNTLKPDWLNCEPQYCHFSIWALEFYATLLYLSRRLDTVYLYCKRSSSSSFLFCVT